MISALLQPLSFAFMQRGFLEAVIVGIVCAVLGCYVVLRSMAFLGDALAHAVLPGVAVAYLLGGNLLIGALIAAVAVALSIGLLSHSGTLKEDTAIGILFAAALSLGIALISSIRTYAVDLTHILFGDLLGVSPMDLWITGILAVIVLAVIIIFYKPFLVVLFDPVLATSLKLPADSLQALLLLLLALTIVFSMQTVGVGLVTAMLITPAATASLLTRRLPSMMAMAALIGALSSIFGLYLSFYLNISSGAAIVLIATAFFLFVFLSSPNRGFISRIVSKPDKK
jgi:manganese/iron transport system permease protein